jgi:replicative DNA helicase
MECQVLAFLDGIIIDILEDCIMGTQVLSQQEIDQLLGQVAMPDPVPFRKAFYAILKRALDFCEIARYKGLFEMDKYLDQEKIDNRDIFEYGISLFCDGPDAPDIDKILSNIIKQENDGQQIVLKTIQKEAVLLFYEFANSHKMATVLNSYTDIPLNAPEFKKIRDESADRMHAWYEKKRIDTSSISLEMLISGLRKSELAIISSTPGKGKTLLALTMAKTLASRSKPTVFISLKESTDAIMETLRKIELPACSADFIPYPHPIHTSKMIFSKLEERIREECANEDIQAVFVDYLELLYGGNTEYAVWIPALKALAKNLNILIVVVLQIPEGKECSQNVIQSIISSSDAHKCIDTLILINEIDTQKRVLEVHNAPYTNEHWRNRDRVEWKLT